MVRGDLAEFLRARRALIGPAAVGLAVGGRRHVRGLRREELALLAGISVDYYVRLEQGRDRNPSPEVVGALARSLRLDGDATAHLHHLSGTPARAARAPGQQVRPGVALLIETSPWPAVLLDHTLTVLGSNALARALNPGNRPGRNLIRDAFLDPATARLHRDPDAVRGECAAALRSAAGLHGTDRTLRVLISELSAASPHFRRIWPEANVSYCRTGRKRFAHPAVGVLALDYETLEVGDAGGDTAAGQRIVVYTAEPGSPDGDRLALLAQSSSEPSRSPSVSR